MVLLVPLLLTLFSLIPEVYGICSESDITCTTGSGYTRCTINALNASRASYLIKQCTIELVQNGMTEPTFIVNLQENGTIILEIAEDITIFSFLVYGINSVDFISAQLQQLSMGGILYHVLTIS